MNQSLLQNNLQKNIQKYYVISLLTFFMRCVIILSLLFALLSFIYEICVSYNNNYININNRRMYKKYTTR